MSTMTGQNIGIRLLNESDAPALLKLKQDNQAFLAPFEPIRDANFLTLEWTLQSIETNRQAAAQDVARSYGIFLKNSEQLIGNISITGIMRGPAQYANLGYFLAEEHNGKGYMTEAVKLCISIAFHELKLHRLQAGVMPRNKRSGRVLEKAGFREEGLAKRYLKINGKWEDHTLYAITVEDLDDNSQ